MTHPSMNLLRGVTGRHVDSSTHHDPGNGNDTNNQASRVALDEEEGDAYRERVRVGASVLKEEKYWRMHTCKSTNMS